MEFFLSFFIVILSYGSFLCANEPSSDILETVLKELNDVQEKLASQDRVIEELQRKNAELEDKIKRQESSVQHHVALSRHEKRQEIGQVAFTVGVSTGDLSNLGQHQVVIFDRAISNLGNAYHRHSGLFLAPVQGYYCFTLALMVLPQKNTYLQIVRDGQLITDIYADSRTSGSHTSTTKQWIFEVNKGSEVWIRSGSAGGEVHGNMHTLLSGFLLLQTE